MDKSLEIAGHEYFSKLYGATSSEGEPQQTVFDKWRDKILVNSYHLLYLSVFLYCALNLSDVIPIHLITIVSSSSKDTIAAEFGHL